MHSCIILQFFINIHKTNMLLYACAMKTNLMQFLSSLYFVNQSLHVSGIFVAYHQEVYCIYTTIGTCRAFQLTVCIPPDYRLQICPKHVDVD